MLPFTSFARASGMLRTSLAVALMTSSFCASATLVTARGSLGGDDSIDWAQLGPDGTEITPQPGAVTSTGGRSASVRNPNGVLYRLDEGAGTYSGNFAIGDALLTTFFNNGPISIDFGSVLVARVGAQIQSLVLGSFVGRLSVFGATDNLLESVTFGGESNFNADNSAIFLGLTRAVADIDRIEFSVEGGSLNSDFALAINQLDFGLRGTGVPVPEPGSLALVGVALAAAAWRRRASTAGYSRTNPA